MLGVQGSRIKNEVLAGLGCGLGSTMKKEGLMFWFKGLGLAHTSPWEIQMIQSGLQS